MDKIAILIPCYNESQTIFQVVSDFKKAIPEATVYVCDNNSTDDTALLAEKAGARVIYEHKQGKGNVIRSMFRKIDAECYIIADGDNAFPAEKAILMVQLILQKKFDMIIGNRFYYNHTFTNKRLFHSFGNSLVRKMVNLLFKNKIQISRKI